MSTMSHLSALRLAYKCTQVLVLFTYLGGMLVEQLRPLTTEPGRGLGRGVSSKLADKGSDSSPICKRRPGHSVERVNGSITLIKSVSHALLDRLMNICHDPVKDAFDLPRPLLASCKASTHKMAERQVSSYH